MANIKMTNMKRLFSSVLLPAALAIVIGCEEIKPDSQEQKTFKLTVSMPDVSEQQPRTHIERLGDVFRTYWSIGDDISINGHISSQPMTIASAAGSRTELNSLFIYVILIFAIVS